MDGFKTTTGYINTEICCEKVYFTQGTHNLAVARGAIPCGAKCLDTGPVSDNLEQAVHSIISLCTIAIWAVSTLLKLLIKTPTVDPKSKTKIKMLDEESLASSLYS